MARLATHADLGAQMAESSDQLWAILKEFLLPVGGPAAGALIGYRAGKKKMDADAIKIEAEADGIQLDAITRHFSALIDGYEKRIDDLTAEINALREEVKSLRKALDQRPQTVQ